MEENEGWQTEHIRTAFSLGTELLVTLSEF